jgi:hypothetical protein
VSPHHLLLRCLLDDDQRRLQKENLPGLCLGLQLPRHHWSIPPTLMQTAQKSAKTARPVAACCRNGNGRPGPVLSPVQQLPAVPPGAVAKWESCCGPQCVLAQQRPDSPVHMQSPRPPVQRHARTPPVPGASGSHELHLVPPHQRPCQQQQQQQTPLSQQAVLKLHACHESIPTPWQLLLLYDNDHQSQQSQPAANKRCGVLHCW